MSSKLKIQYSRSQCTSCDRFYILDALPEAEASAGTKTRENIIDGVLAQNVESYGEARDLVRRIDCPDVAAFDAAIALVRKDAEEGGRPMLFIHGHGEEKAGLQLASGVYVSWSAYLAALGSITLASGGELTVVAAFCHSMAPITLLPRTGRLPFAFYYGYDNTITAGEVHDETSRLYSGFLRDGGRTKPDMPTLKSHSEYDHIDGVLIQFLSLYGLLEHAERAIPILSIRKAVRSVEETWPEQGVPLGGVGRDIKKVIMSEELVASTLGKFMYDTERRSRLIGEVYRWREQAQQGAFSSATPAM